MSEQHAIGRRGDVLGVPFNWLNFADVYGTIDGWRDDGTRGYICITNPHSVMLCQRNAEMRRATIGADLVLPDGVGIILAAQVLGLPHKGRVTGPELMLRLCDWGRRDNYRHYFLGGGPGVPESLAERLTAAYPGLNIAGYESPPFRQLTRDEDDRLVARINSRRPDIVWVGLGAPKQEKWIAEHAHRIHTTVMIGVGAAFDFHSGSVAWAPDWMRKSGLEWLHRLLSNPTRMWRRNLDSVGFLYQVARQKATSAQREDIYVSTEK